MRLSGSTVGGALEGHSDRSAGHRRGHDTGAGAGHAQTGPMREHVQSVFWGIDFPPPPNPSGFSLWFCSRSGGKFGFILIVQAKQLADATHVALAGGASLFFVGVPDIRLGMIVPELIHTSEFPIEQRKPRV